MKKSKRAAEGTLAEILRAVPVKKGDVFFIPSGTVHAIGAGLVIAEIQQNSNVTYRVFDYGRLGADGHDGEFSSACGAESFHALLVTDGAGTMACGGVREKYGRASASPLWMKRPFRS